MSAIYAARNGVEVDIFEQNSAIGKKILISGNGRCNIANTHISQEDFYSSNAPFVQEVLSHYSYEDFKAFAHSIALFLEEKSDGRVYPLSNEAKSFVHALRNCATHLGITIHTDAKVERLTKKAKGFSFTCKQTTYHYKKVLIATGSKAAEQLGANESGMDMAKKLGHTLLPTYPALVGLHVDNPLFHRISGLKLHAKLTLHVNNHPLQSVEGDLLFTKYGLSGFAILDISILASKALMQKERVSLHVNFLPQFSKESLLDAFYALQAEVEYLSLLDLLSAFISQKLAKTLLKMVHLSEGRTFYTLERREVDRLIESIVKCTITISDTHGFRHAEVSGGGVDTSEIEPTTMESKLLKGLYFAGEVVDVIGKRGGYNFFFAYASAFIAAKAISEE